MLIGETMDALPISLLATSAMRPVASGSLPVGTSAGAGFAALLQSSTDAGPTMVDQRQTGAGGGGDLPVATLAPEIGPDILVVDDPLPIDHDVASLSGIPPILPPSVALLAVPTAVTRPDVAATRPPTAPKRAIAAPSLPLLTASALAAPVADDPARPEAAADTKNDPDGQVLPAPSVAMPILPDVPAAPPLVTMPPTLAPGVSERTAGTRILASSGAVASFSNRDGLDRTRTSDAISIPPAAILPALPLPAIARAPTAAATLSVAASPLDEAAASMMQIPAVPTTPIAAAVRLAATEGTLGVDTMASDPKIAPPAPLGIAWPATGGTTPTSAATVGTAALLLPSVAAPLPLTSLPPAPPPAAAPLVLPSPTRDALAPVVASAASSPSPIASPATANRAAEAVPSGRAPDIAAGLSAAALAVAPTPTPGPSLRAGDRASAAQLFAAAIRSADRQDAERDRPADPASALVGLSVATTPPIQTTGDRQPNLDLARHDWPGRMIEHIETLRDAADATSTRIRLSPDALGGINVSLHHQRDGTVQVALAADRAGTQALIADAQPELARLGETRGLRFADSSSGFGGGRGGGSGGGASAGRSDSQQPRRPARPLAAAAPHATDPTDTASARVA